MTNTAQLHNVEIKTLADKAMLARLSRRRISTSVRDKSLEGSVRATTGDDSITVSKHLFKDKNSFVRKLILAFDEVYRLHIENTMPWIDRGPRLLPSKNYMQYMETMRQAIEQVDRMVPYVVDNWSALVDEDIVRRGGTASRGDYPARMKVADSFSVDLQVLPLPDTSDFRVEVDDATRDALQTALEEAEQAARADIIRRMMEPIEKAVAKLSTPIGEQGSIFRDSLLNNLFDGIAQAKSLNISDDPELARQIELIEAKVGEVANPSAAPLLREDENRRKQAHDALSDIMGQLGQM